MEWAFEQHAIAWHAVDNDDAFEWVVSTRLYKFIYNQLAVRFDEATAANTMWEYTTRSHMIQA